MEPLRIAFLASAHAPGLDWLLADPNRGTTFEMSIVIGSESRLADAETLEKAGVPVELRPLRSVGAFRDLHEREGYYEQIGDLLARMKIDYVILTGYDHIVTEPVLARFPGRVLALHPADLTLRRDDRLYAGPHAVRDAIFAGERETRSSIYVVTGEAGRGPLMLLSGSYPIAPMAQDARERGDAGFLSAYADLHRRWMISDSWGPMLRRCLELLAGGTTKIVGDTVWIDGTPGPCRFGESPASCHQPEAMVTRGIPRSCPFIG